MNFPSRAIRILVVICSLVFHHQAFAQTVGDDVISNTNVALYTAPPTLAEKDIYLGANTSGRVIDGPIAGTADGYTGNWLHVRWDIGPGYDGWVPETSLTITSTVQYLQNGVERPNISGADHEEKFYKIVVPPGRTSLTISTSSPVLANHGQTYGDCDLYVSFGSKPSYDTWDYRPFTWWSNEGITIINPSAGTWYIMLYGMPAGPGRYRNVSLTATYDGDEVYEAELIASPKDLGETSGEGIYAKNASVTVTATPKDGCRFVNWTSAGTVVSESATYTFSITENLALVANFKEIENFTVTLGTNGTGFYSASVSGDGTFVEGSQITVSTAIESTVYLFVNWTENGTVVSTTPDYTFTLDRSRDLEANYVLSPDYASIILYAAPTTAGTVSYNSAPSWSYWSNVYTIVAKGSTFTARAQPNDGYYFVSWTEGGTFYANSSTYSFTVDSDRLLHANFAKISDSYTISVDAEPGTGGSVGGGGTFPGGSMQTVVASESSGYTFVSWMENGAVVSTSHSYAFTLTEDRNLTAVFAPTFAITLISSPGIGGGTSGGGSYAIGDTQTVVAIPSTGYEFVNWTENGTVVSAESSFTFSVSGARTLVANFEEIRLPYTLEVRSAPGIGGTVTGAGTYLSGAAPKVTATPRSGYAFVNWTENGVEISRAPSYTFTITADRNLVAHFSTPRTLTVTASPSIGGTATGSGTFAYGATQQIHATASSGYVFVNWTKGGVVLGTSPTLSMVMNGNYNVVANFRLKYTLEVTASPSVGGRVEGGGTFASNTVQRVTATPESGYTFVGWTEDGRIVSKSTTYAFNLKGHRSLVANFKTIHTIDVSATPAAGGTVGGGGTFIFGATARVTATPRSGYIFLHWTQGQAVVSTSATYVFNVTESRTLVANFGLIRSLNVTSLPSSGGRVTGGGHFVNGSTLVVTATANAGHTFANWSENGTIVSTAPRYEFVLNSDRTLVANFSSVNTVKTIASPLYGGVTSGEGSFLNGRVVSVSASANDDYRFINWTLNGQVVSTTPIYEFTLENNVTLVAHFKPLDRLTVLNSGEGTSSGGGSFVHGTSVTANAHPDIGSVFNGWRENGRIVSRNATYTFALNGDRVLTAEFLKYITLNVVAIGNGTVLPDGITGMAEGTSFTPRAVPAVGYRFIGWTDGTGRALTLPIAVWEDMTVEAHFEGIPVPVTKVTLIDSHDPTRTSSASLSLVLPTIGDKRVIIAKANENASGTWYDGDKMIGSGHAIAYEIGDGPHQIECRNEKGSRSATAVGSPKVEIDGEIDLSKIQEALDILDRVAKVCGQNAGVVQWDVAETYHSETVDKTNSPTIGTSKEIGASGKASLELEEAYIPGASVRLPYFRAGVFIQPALYVDVDVALSNDASTNPASYGGGGGATISGSVSGGLGAEVLDKDVIAIEADFRGTVEATGNFNIRTNPAVLSGDYSIGKLTLSGQAAIYLQGQPVVEFSKSVTAWNGISGKKSVNLNSYIK